MLLITGVFMYLSGLICKYFYDDYEKYPNLIVGYKTKTAMQNKESWIFANNFFYKACSISLIFAITSTFIIEFMKLDISNLIYIMLQLLIFLFPVIITEFNLYKLNKK